MNTESVDLRRIKVPVPHDVEVKPGDFAWDFDSEKLGGKQGAQTAFIYLCLPGEKNLTAVEVTRGAPGGNRVWGWDGNEDKPTLTPSIHAVGSWHGYLRAGRLCSC
jgi:hypothetical protein